MLFRVNADLFSAALQRLEFYNAVGEGKKRVVRPAPDIYARMDLCAALTHYDVSGYDRLPVRLLHAETLGFRVSAVFGGADALFMCK